MLQRLVDSSGRSVKVIHVRKLFNALMKGTTVFLLELQGNFERQQLVFLRVQKLITPFNEGDARIVYREIFGSPDGEK